MKSSTNNGACEAGTISSSSRPPSYGVGFLFDYCSDTSVNLVLAGMTELVFTAILTFSITGVIYSHLVGTGGPVTPTTFTSDPLAVLVLSLVTGLAYSACTFATVNISGGGLNPVFSAALWGLRRISLFRALIFIACQLIGGILGSAFLYSLIPASVLNPGHPLPLYLGVAKIDNTLYDIGNAIWVETVFSFVITLVGILTTARPITEKEDTPNYDNPKVSIPAYHGLAPGFTLIALSAIGVRLTGCIGNPARAFGPAVVSGDYSDIGIYFAGGFAGAGIAVVVYWLMYFYTSGNLSRIVSRINQATVTGTTTINGIMYRKLKF